MIQAVVFDLDDTLYPEMEFVYSGYRAVSDYIQKRYGVVIYGELVELFARGNRGDLFTPVLEQYLTNVEESYIRHLVQIYRNHKPIISPFPEARLVLSELLRSYRLSIISDGYLGVQKRKLNALNLREYFETVIFSDIWGRDFWKPHPKPYEECARSLSLDPSDMVYVGDNPAKDFVTARQLGMTTIRVRRQGTLHRNVSLSSRFTANYEVKNLAEVTHMLKSIDHRQNC